MPHPFWETAQDAIDFKRPPTDSVKRFRICAVLAALALALWLLFSSFSSSPTFVPPPIYSGMTVLHVVAFKLADTAKLPALSEGMLALKEQCVREDGSRYIVSAVGGKQSNTEGHDGGMQVVFLVEFENQEDADYYINHDSAHTAFKDKLGSMDLEGVTVLDFTPGAF